MCTSMTGTSRARERVKDRDGGVAVSGRIDEQSGRLLGARLLDPVDDFALVIGLAKFDR